MQLFKLAQKLKMVTLLFDRFLWVLSLYRKNLVYHAKNFEIKIPGGFFSDSLFIPHTFPFQIKNRFSENETFNISRTNSYIEVKNRSIVSVFCIHSNWYDTFQK